MNIKYKLMPTPTQYMLLGLVARLGFIGYAEIQDKYFNLKYTDIDYSVYTDGSKYVLQGGTPYDRHTYRYTPLVAYMMIPNVVWFESFGKVLFSVFDVIIAYLINKIIRMTSTATNESTRSFLIALWLFNPVTLQVSTRGNADTIVVFLVYITLYLLLKKQIALAALTYGFVVHFKIYPIIYSVTIFLYIDHERQNKSSLMPTIFTRNRIKFALLSLGVFVGLILLFDWVYPDVFLYQTYLYHFIRKDNRHNFSPYFYFIYLQFSQMTPMQSTLAFLPQLIIVAISGIKYYHDLPFAMLLQTLGFVTFNKVCTAQYFVWWLALLPLALTNSELKENKRKEFFQLCLVWVFFEVLWNVGAYLVEIRGVNAFVIIFITCIVFFIVNIYLMYTLIVNQRTRRFVDLKAIKKE